MVPPSSPSGSSKTTILALEQLSRGLGRDLANPHHLREKATCTCIHSIHATPFEYYVTTERPWKLSSHFWFTGPAQRIYMELFMKILEILKQAFIPMNQPRSFPRLYFIPETITFDAPNQAIKDPFYQRDLTPVKQQSLRRPQLPKPAKYLQQLRARFYHLRARAWSALKAFGRRVVRWLAWRVVLPLSVLCAVWIPYVSPAELPL